MAHRPDITLSVVSHRQNALVSRLLDDVQRACPEVELIITENTPDATALVSSLAFTRIVNPRPRGFGANHNAAFARSTTPYFCVCNPDIRLPKTPFPPLLEALSGDAVGVAGPLVRDSQGAVQDSARRFPTPLSLLKKLLLRPRGPDYPTDSGPLVVDWIAGMFMLFPAHAFRALGGFDERYFLYYEDVDICRRMRAASLRAVFQPQAEVLHDARRESRRNPGLALHHLRSALRFLSRS